MLGNGLHGGKVEEHAWLVLHITYKRSCLWKATVVVHILVTHVYVFCMLR